MISFTTGNWGLEIVVNVRLYFASHTTNYKCKQHVHTGKQLSYWKISQKRIEKYVGRENDFVVWDRIRWWYVTSWGRWTAHCYMQRSKLPKFVNSLSDYKCYPHRIWSRCPNPRVKLSTIFRPRWHNVPKIPQLRENFTLQTCFAQMAV